MKFTKEEIYLCKQIAEKYVKKIDSGDWWIGANDKPVLAYGNVKFTKKYKLTPLWTISDCLQFLRERGFRFILHHYDVGEYHLGYGRDDTGQWRDIEQPGKTPLEACLKTVLAVLEDRR